MSHKIARRLAMLVTGCAMTLAAPVTAECLRGPVRVKLPAQPLDERAAALARVTGCFMEGDAALLAERRAPALRGRVTTEQALLRSLRGSGLEAAPYKGHWRIDRRQQERFARRIATLRGTLEQQRGVLPPSRSTSIARDLARVEKGVARDVRQQGFLSAAERSSYNATLDRAATRMGVTVPKLPRGWIAPVA